MSPAESIFDTAKQSNPPTPTFDKSAQKKQIHAMYNV